MKPLTSGRAAPEIWSKVWKEDSYASASLRLRRAKRRLSEFGFANNPLPAGAKFLELGCGTGEGLKLIGEVSAPSISLFGVDFSSAAIVKARENLKETGVLAVADACRLPFDDDTFCGVSAFGVLEHIPDVSMAINEIRRITRPGFNIYITTSNKKSVLQSINLIRLNFLKYPYGFQRNWSKDDIMEKFHGWSEIEFLKVVHADWDMPIVACADRLIGFVQPDWGRYLFARCRKKIQ